MAEEIVVEKAGKRVEKKRTSKAVENLNILENDSQIDNVDDYNP